VTGHVHNLALVPPGPAASEPRPASANVAANGPAFADVLQSVSFSNHALARLQRRGIEVDAATAQRLDTGVSRAAAKGSRDAVVLVDDTAFVVAVRNRTVITAVDSAHMRDHVFTNIDSAVIA
jgi:flagellar operon protein